MTTVLRSSWLVVLLCAATACALAAEPLLSPDEIRRLDRENELWRQLRTDHDSEANVLRLRRQGATDEELAWFAPKLEAIWNIDVPRAWGWLRSEQIEAIKEVDRAFVPRLRAARLRAATGIEIEPAHRGETLLAVNSRWQRAVLRALDYDQIGEFRLMNSPSAQKAARHFENVPLTDDERRTIYEWQHDYEAAKGSGGGRFNAAQREAKLYHYRRLRDLIGDDRFAVHLASAEPKFARLQDALGEDIDSTTAIDAWWLCELFWLEYEGPRPFGVSSHQLATRTEERLKARLGETLFARFVASNESRWLTDLKIPRLRVQKK